FLNAIFSHAISHPRTDKKGSGDLRVLGLGGLRRSFARSTAENSDYFPLTLPCETKEVVKWRLGHHEGLLVHTSKIWHLGTCYLDLNFMPKS
ncbi:MAG: hypothetical protein M1303_03895, partial [Bacteroidetes bacterium]|nr:hypothetical protein [Bacteroidota bacterium]